MRRLTVELCSAYARNSVIRHPLRCGDLRAIGAMFAMLIVSACSDPSSPTPVTSAPSLLCPAAPATTTVTSGQSAVVVYGAASATGGTAPVSVTCAPASGSSFPIGTTNVTCTATDAARRSASCAFTVSVVNSPTLGVKRILAFGDSITAGEVPVNGEFRTTSIRPYFVELDNSYPADLVNILAKNYVAQGAIRIDAVLVRSDNSTDCTDTNPPIPTTSAIVVINAGCLGEPAEVDPQRPQFNAPARLINKLHIYRPDLVLLMEGTNDLNRNVPVSVGANAVANLVTIVRANNIPVLVGTITPEVGSELTHGGEPDLVGPFNAALMPAVTAAGARAIVNIWAVLSQNTDRWISQYDGLHPSADGYQEIAQLWFNAIKQLYENTGSVTTTSTIRKR